jgi:glycerophosphoryl diester phosphodiesterase
MLAHRGLWGVRSQQNTLEALVGALEAGYGLETDVRDFAGELVIAHDPPTSAEPPLGFLLSRYAASRHPGLLALNIKADGLCGPLMELLARFRIQNYVVFDMSVPDTLAYVRAGARVLIRRSEVESHPELEAHSVGIWVDELTRPWLDAVKLQALLADGRMVCVVSAELHGREREAQWRELITGRGLAASPAGFYLCTDFPDAGAEAFA